jgi:hypothetical protein
VSWIGAGMAGVYGLNAGLRSQRSRYRHSSALACISSPQPARAARARDLTAANVKEATQLGTFKVYADQVSADRIEVAKRIAGRQAAARQLGDGSVSAALRAHVPHRGGAGVRSSEPSMARDPIDAAPPRTTLDGR